MYVYVIYIHIYKYIYVYTHIYRKYNKYKFININKLN